MMESSFSDELWAQIRKDFGNHFVHQKEYKKAISNYETSLLLQPENLDCVNRLTRVQISQGEVDKALNLLRKKSELDTYKNHFNCNFQESNCFFEKNNFEQNILSLNDKKLIYQNAFIDIPHCGPLTLEKLNGAKYKGPKLSSLNRQFDIVRTNYDNMIGKNCLYKNRRFFDKVLQERKPPIVHKNRGPLVLMGDDPCEFIRNKEKIVIPKTVKEQYRYDRVQRFFAQSYMHSGWKDFIFINELKTHKVLKKSTQNKESFESIQRSIDECIERNSKIIEQLHARCPLYTKRQATRSEKTDKIMKFRMQAKIRRETFNALDVILNCFEEKNLEKLINLAEYELGVRYRIHPTSLLPRKKEFAVDICNYIALAHIDDIIKSKDLIYSTDYSDIELLEKLLRIHWKGKSVAVPYIFGDQSTYRDPTEPDKSFMEFRKNVVRLERRLSQKPMLKIENCHLLHEMGRANLKQKRPDKAREFGEQIIEEAQEVSYSWIFLGQLLICRADVIQRQFKNAKLSMEKVISMIDIFKSSELKLVLEKANEIVQRLS